MAIPIATLHGCRSRERLDKCQSHWRDAIGTATHAQVIRMVDIGKQTWETLLQLTLQERSTSLHLNNTCTDTEEFWEVWAVSDTWNNVYKSLGILQSLVRRRGVHAEVHFALMTRRSTFKRPTKVCLR